MIAIDRFMVIYSLIAEKVGFEPTEQLMDVRSFSKGVPSTARPLLRVPVFAGCHWLVVDCAEVCRG